MLFHGSALLSSVTGVAFSLCVGFIGVEFCSVLFWGRLPTGLEEEAAGSVMVFLGRTLSVSSVVPTTPALCVGPETGFWSVFAARLGEYAGGGAWSCGTLSTPPLASDLWFWAISVKLVSSFSLVGGFGEYSGGGPDGGCTLS